MKKKTLIWSVENVVLLSCLLVLFLILSLTAWDISGSWRFRVIWMAVSLVVSIFVGYTVFSLRSRNRRAEDEWFMLKKQHSENSMQENYQKESEALIAECERLRQNQQVIYTQIMEYMAKERYDEIVPFLQQKLPYIDYGAAFISGNQVMDVILNQKILRAGKEGIHLHCDVQLPRLKELRETDLNVLLSNLLDNAIEATMRWREHIYSDIFTDGRQEDIISFRVRTYKNYLLIYEENPCVRSGEEKGNRLQTSKGNTDMHGIGMQSMQRIVDRYQGMMEYKITEGRFSIRIVMEDKYIG